MAGVLDVEAILRRPSKWFRGWEHYYEMEPFDQVPANYRAASICQTIANVNRGKNQRAYKIDEFLLKFDDGDKPVAREQTVQEKLNVMTVIMRAMAEVKAEEDKKLSKLNAMAVAETAEAHGVKIE